MPPDFFLNHEYSLQFHQTRHLLPMCFSVDAYDSFIDKDMQLRELTSNWPSSDLVAPATMAHSRWQPDINLLWTCILKRLKGLAAEASRTYTNISSSKNGSCMDTHTEKRHVGETLSCQLSIPHVQDTPQPYMPDL